MRDKETRLQHVRIAPGRIEAAIAIRDVLCCADLSVLLALCGSTIAIMVTLGQAASSA
jgi:hypothetical protein